MPQRLTDSRLANLGAHAIHVACNAFQNRFKAITRRASTHFESRDWHRMHVDAVERLELYKHVVDQTVAEIRRLLDDRVADTLVWASIKAVYSGLIAERDDWEIAETFFNSITRRVFATVGVDRQIEFVDTDFETPPTQAHQQVYRTYKRGLDTAALITSILADHQLDAVCEDLPRDAQLAAEKIDDHLQSLGVQYRLLRAEMITSVFYRNKGAYLVGRIRSDTLVIPLVLALLNTPQGIIIDAVLLRERAVNILFSFTRSYFHVDVERPYDLVCFLRSIMPRKRIAELYTAIGYHKHGKTELYRDLLHHLAACDERFEVARPSRGPAPSRSGGA